MIETREELLKLLALATKVRQSASDDFEQKVSFVYSCLPSSSTMTKDDVRSMLRAGS